MASACGKPLVKRPAKAFTDAALTILLLACMGCQFFGGMSHELLGTAMLALLILHHVLNRKWYGSLFKGRYGAVRALYTVLGLLLIVVTLALMYSGVVISRYVFGFLQIESGTALARRLHLACSYWGFILMSLHIGLHCGRAFAAMNRRIRCAALALWMLLSAYGIYAFISRGFADFLLFRSEFAFADGSEPAVYFYLDYLAVMSACAALSYAVKKLISSHGTKHV